MSCLYEAPTVVGPPDSWFAFGACANNDQAENKPSPTSASKMAIEQRTKPSRMRGLKKADSDADFVFMGDLRETINQARRMSRFIMRKARDYLVRSATQSHQCNARWRVDLTCLQAS